MKTNNVDAKPPQQWGSCFFRDVTQITRYTSTLTINNLDTHLQCGDLISDKSPQYIYYESLFRILNLRTVLIDTLVNLQKARA